MQNDMQPIESIQIESKIIMLRGKQVMIDRDLAELYGVETKRLNEQVRRNIERFPEEFMFRLNEEEFSFLRSQIATSKTETRGGRQYLPYAFTEQGCAMLSAVLRSETAVNVSIQIMKAFVSMRHFLQNNAEIFAELKSIRQHQIEQDVHLLNVDSRINELFDRMDKYAIDDKQGIFFQGQIFDAYSKFESFIRSASEEIILIDNYVDISVLNLLAKKQLNVKITIYTNPKTKLTEQDIKKFNDQYPHLTVKYTSKMHDRFLIIDNAVLYHIGTSLKDLGKKCFAFEMLDKDFIETVLNNI